MNAMTSKERFTRMFEHKEADRVPIIDAPWEGTIRRWQNEGMPVGADWRDYFDVDKVATIGVNTSPNYEEKTIEETDTYRIYTTSSGVTLKKFKVLDSTPQFLDHKVSTSKIWFEETKKRIQDDTERIDWKYIDSRYEQWKAQGQWIQAGFWFGFDVTHSWMVGTETTLIAMMEEPEWVMDMFETYLDCCIKLFDKIWDRGYRFDVIRWPDDMGYKNTTFFSPDTYARMLKPYHKRAVEWAHNKGIYAHLHSCGDIMTLVPQLVEIGIDALNPLEIKAGMDPLKLKKEYGDKLVLHGGLNAVLWDDKEAVVREIERLVPVLKENGGYIFSSDHSIPNTVTLENFKAIVKTVKRVGKY
jgi:uroporphyrinogen decarboxylase